MEEKELSLEELDNVFGGIPREAGIEKARRSDDQENKTIREQIAELKQQREVIISSPESKETHANTQSGRSK